MSKDPSRRERLFGEFIEQASKVFGDALLQDHLDDPAKLVPLYATLNKLRLIATPRTIGAAEAVLDRLVETYGLPPDELTEPALGQRRSRHPARFHAVLSCGADGVVR